MRRTMIPEVLTPKQLKEIFFEKNQKCHEIKESNNSIGEFISSNDEVWIMQCPKGMDISVLQDQKLKLPGRSNQSTLETVAVEYPQPVQHGFGYKNRKGHNSIKLVPVQGSIILRNRIKPSLPPEEIPMQSPSKSRVPMPEFIKERHPLHGVDYAKKLEIDPEIAARLKEASEISTSSKRKKSKSKNKTKEPRTIPMDSDGEVELVMQKKPKKKRKHMDSSGSDATSKKKQRKNGISDDLQWIEKL